MVGVLTGAAVTQRNDAFRLYNYDRSTRHGRSREEATGSERKGLDCVGWFQQSNPRTRSNASVKAHSHLSVRVRAWSFWHLDTDCVRAACAHVCLCMCEDGWVVLCKPEHWSSPQQPPHSPPGWVSQQNWGNLLDIFQWNSPSPRGEKTTHPRTSARAHWTPEIAGRLPGTRNLSKHHYTFPCHKCGPETDPEPGWRWWTMIGAGCGSPSPPCLLHPTVGFLLCSPPVSIEWYSRINIYSIGPNRPESSVCKLMFCQLQHCSTHTPNVFSWDNLWLRCQVGYPPRTPNRLLTDRVM